ncbi:hypothetical protein JEQ12_004258 [Ovis aries]|uniref:Uncharacterized protein n=1 Tax=Ovis aries TaxID=9940 RepID=A0A836CWE7_SHEEP|nr:hypothetical protein JEQ12_004258 [Ovis aries]
MTDVAVRMSEEQLVELRAVIKHFVSERKYDEDLGRVPRFTCDVETLKKNTDSFGQKTGAGRAQVSELILRLNWLQHPLPPTDEERTCGLLTFHWGRYPFRPFQDGEQVEAGLRDAGLKGFVLTRICAMQPWLHHHAGPRGGTQSSGRQARCRQALLCVCRCPNPCEGKKTKTECSASSWKDPLDTLGSFLETLLHCSGKPGKEQASTVIFWDTQGLTLPLASVIGRIKSVSFGADYSDI